MTLVEHLNDDLKAAMRGGDTLRRDTLRLLLAAIRKAELAEEAAAYDKQSAEHPGEEAASRVAPVHLDDDGALAVVRREVKQRQDSIDAYSKAGRTALAEKEQAEMTILQGYLPRQLDREAISAVVSGIIEELGATGPADLKRVMPKAMEALRGRADGREVNAVVVELLRGR
ncbi:MAG: GatB/YqeY domain-containing protein [Dehalococcoidia bacterium]